MNALAVILARAGSRGVRAKNTRLVAGRPCIDWTIDAAAAASMIDVTCLSSDDPLALELGRDAGVTIVERPVELATDHAPIDDAVRHACLQCERDRTFDAVVVLYANVPVRPPDLIDRAVSLLIETGADSVQSYTPVGKHHPWWLTRVDPESAVVSPWEGDRLNNGVYRRQDLPPAWIPDGGVIAIRRSALFGESDAPTGPHAFLGVDHRAITTPEGAVIDIDAHADLLVADALLATRPRPVPVVA